MIHFAQLKGFIQKQGWSDFGVVSAEVLSQNLHDHKIVFSDWLKNRFHGQMDYLLRMKDDRYDLSNKLPDVRSVIVLCANYSDGGPNLANYEAHHALIARYAAGRDYHKVLKKKLDNLSNYLQQKDSATRTYGSVDSGPLPDRVLAEAAGLGFFGKNACLINPKKGSYFFIAALLTNLDLEPSAKPHMPNCGNCTRCQVACPTGAILGHGQINARLCISYLTIENREGIPVELRPKIGNRLFGCDICQEVCPFNQLRAHKQEIQIDELKGAYGVGGTLDLREILNIRTDEVYVQKFAGTPLMRAKRRGLVRNACIVAGNSKNPALIPYLQAVVDEEDDAMLKEHAEWGIQQLKQ
ncbi:tRNA epoxyqueuosine(34) reductase QueG [Candidatus Peregrinibacteria bacterium]|nr:MAG: tRNA epoxyqueuosine(34) reductase QueG [Candidatus Peregrinibacteria bacterium]